MAASLLLVDPHQIGKHRFLEFFLIGIKKLHVAILGKNLNRTGGTIFCSDYDKSSHANQICHSPLKWYRAKKIQSQIN
jgi:hypothetical protein